MKIYKFRSIKRYKHYFDADQRYDLGSDTKEQNNLYEDNANAGKLKELKKELKKYLAFSESTKPNNEFGACSSFPTNN
ncbi:hypothetical protein [Marinifilum caeruleilacunae]|uniref:Uncharacterized protein n=1 Tax=Marinifilum caeruleilacunae TaxID=2499076 RepID=A0ABX1WXG5_9BACT|nr:hypothetical protein [Marinifilum caeruleilacunae]NOU60825.1 hypothetical protein [Marinifilum caeruleilacunae]